jgi:hypothetical protein
VRRTRRGGGDFGHKSWAELDCAQKASSPHFWAQPSLYSVQEWRERNPILQRRCGSHAASTIVANTVRGHWPSAALESTAK